MKSDNFPELRTQRLLLRKLDNADYKTIFFLRSDKNVNQFLKRVKPKNKEDVIKFIEKINTNISNNQCLYWSIFLMDTKKMIGTICLWNFSKEENKAEIGYELNPDFHKKGLMTEALKCVLNFGFKMLNFNKIEAFTHKENTSSIKLLLTNKFKLNPNKEDHSNSANLIFKIENPMG